jgi:hypothetical protein
VSVNKCITHYHTGYLVLLLLESGSGMLLVLLLSIQCLFLLRFVRGDAGLPESGRCDWAAEAGAAVVRPLLERARVEVQ